MNLLVTILKNNIIVLVYELQLEVPKNAAISSYQKKTHYFNLKVPWQASQSSFL
jgi:hypothetical protein